MKTSSKQPNWLGKALLTGIMLGLLIYLCVTLYMGTLPFFSVVGILLVAATLTLLILPFLQRNK